MVKWKQRNVRPVIKVFKKELQFFYVLNVLKRKLLDVGIVGKLELDIFASNANGVVPIKMAQMVVTFKIMPESPDVSLEDIKKSAEAKIKSYVGNGEIRFEEEPIGFGLVSLKLLFAIDEEKSLDELENDLQKLEGISSVEVVDMRRGIG
jgi:translation elongation factor aEF-1 beta